MTIFDCVRNGHLIRPLPVTPVTDTRTSPGLPITFGTMATESPGRSELTQLVAHHIFSHVDLDMSFAVVHQKRMPDEFRGNR